MACGVGQSTLLGGLVIAHLHPAGAGAVIYTYIYRDFPKTIEGVYLSREFRGLPILGPGWLRI